MMLAAQLGFMAGKPYDAEVEYLESTGTQWIDTGIVSTGFGIRTDVVCAQTQSGGEMGIVGRTQSGGFELYTNYNTSKVGIWNRSGNYIELSRRLALSQVYNISAEITSSLITLSIDGDVTTKSITPASFTNGYILVFAHGTFVFKGRVYSCQIYQNSLLVRDFIPVRVGTVGYLYDRVTRKLFGNAGTGDFVLGLDVVPVEWLKSDGTPYIDTGVVVQSSDVIKFRSKSSAGGSSQVDAIQSNVGQWNASPNYYFMTKISGAFAFQVWAYATYKDIITGYSGGDKYIGKVNSWEINLADGFAKIETYDNTYTTSISPGGPSPDQPTLKLMPTNASRAISVYDFSITRNGVKILNFTPVRVGTEGAMMDTLTRRIYRNAGTGAFTYGNDLPYPIPA